MPHYVNRKGIRVQFPTVPLTNDERKEACKAANVADLSTLRFGRLLEPVGTSGAGTPCVLWTDSSGDHVITCDALVTARLAETASPGKSAALKLMVDAIALDGGAPVLPDDASPLLPGTEPAADVTPADPPAEEPKP